MPPSVLAIIPARGGSVSIPKKNLLNVAGQPLLAWTIQAALGAKHVSRTIVSTDDPAIAATAKQYGAEVVERPPEISGPDSPSEAALLHVLDQLEKEDELPDLVAFLQCTSPLTLPEDIDGTIETLIQQQADSALAVVPFHYFLWRRDAEGNAKGINHDHRKRLMRQHRDPEFLEAGAVYVMKTAGLREHCFRFFGQTAMYTMPVHRRWEIDDFDDVSIAEKLLQSSNGAAKAWPSLNDLDAIAFDFDGVFTNNQVIVHADRSESVVCNRADGMGIDKLRKTGMPLVVLSKETNPIASIRCEKLKLECHLNVENKLEKLKSWLESQGLAIERCMFVGNDINDQKCLQAVGYPVVVGDAEPAVLQEGVYVLQRRGGEGAVRELCDRLVPDHP